MVGNSWLWPRLIAAFAASLLSFQTLALAQETKAESPVEEAVEEVVEPLARTALRDLRLAGLADSESIAVQWRYLSNGETIKTAPTFEVPELAITGIKTQSPILTSFADQEVESIIVILVSGKTKKEASYFYDTAKSAVSALPYGKYRVLVGTGGDTFTWVSDVEIETSETQSWEKGFKNVPAEFEAGKASVSDLVRGFADSMEVLKKASPQSRVALIAPQSIFPGKPEILKQLTEAAYAQRISFFPMRPLAGVTPARAQQMNDIAGPTAGRFLPEELSGRTPEERLTLFSEFLSGTSAVFNIAPHQQYSLPGEKIEPVELTVNYGDLTDTMALPLERPVLSGSGLINGFINPAHWGNWLIDKSRWYYGLGALLLWLASLLGLFRLLFPPVKLFVQIAGVEGIQKVRRLPVTIGRGEHAGINLDNEGVSRNHAKISKNGRYLQIKDLESSNGTWIGGERVKSTALTKVQTVQIGPVRLILRPRRISAPVKTVAANG